MPSLKPEQFESIIKSGRLGRLYLFNGPEDWLKNQCVEKIIDALVPPESRDFNLNRYSGENSEASDVVSTINSLPFLSDRRLVIVDAAEEFSAADQRLIGENLSALPKTTCVVFLYSGKSDLREEIPAQVVSHGDVVTFWAPFDNQLPAWVTAEVKRRGKSIAWDAARELAEGCSGLQEISNELDKLILFIGNKPSISLSDVLAQGLPQAAGDYRDLEEALWNRRLPEALRQGQLLSDSGVSAEAIFPVFERLFRTMMLGFYFSKKKNWPLADIYSALNLRGKIQQGLLANGMQKYKPQEVESAFGAIAQADLELKTGVLPSRMAVSLLTLKLLN